MYSFKEKQKHYSELQNPDAASLDLKLLTQKSPSHPLLRKFSRNPQRYANEILYQLLGVAERDEIRNNRRPPVSKSKVINGSQSSKKETEILPIEKSEKVENVIPESPDPDRQDKISDVAEVVEAEERAVEAEERVEEAEERAEEAEERVEEAEERAEEAEERAEEAEERAEEAEERAEEAELRAKGAEERADNAEAELEQEKKKAATTSKPVSNPKVKSKSGKNTPKSTGTTSPTRKSRQPRSSTTTGS